MIFDGDCTFCRRWIERWKQTTGEEVEYRPLQDPEIRARFPELPREQLESAVHLVEPDGRVFRAAEAVFRSRRFTPARARDLTVGASPRRTLGQWLYDTSPPFGAASEAAYHFVATHRAIFSFLTRLLWGTHVERPRHVLVRALFLRLMGLIYFIAFASLWIQVPGLSGSRGIIPAEQVMGSLREQADTQGVGFDRYRIAPTLCWWNASDGFLRGQCVAGMGLAMLVVVGVSPAVCLLALWVLYLSMATVSQLFLGYQWDNLLLEAGLLAVFFAPVRAWPSLRREGPPSRIALWLLRWLAARLMFQSGWVKLASGDPVWRDLTALNFHYETQPLPTWLAWYAHQQPAWLKKASVAGMFGVELVLPFLVFLPRRCRFVACGGFVLLQVAILLTGNYTYFNWLSIALALVLLDDAALQALVRRFRRGARAGVEPHSPPAARAPSKFGRGLRAVRQAGLILLAAIVAGTSFVQLAGLALRRAPDVPPLIRLYQWLAPLRSFNQYGLFAVMTKSRPEIVVEGSVDGQTWLAYEFRYKPGDLAARPRFVAPHQPRLDWQMWFAALGNYRQNPWFVNFCYRLLEGSPEVLALLAKNPFPDRPPRYIRGALYDYHFTDAATRRRDGAWWRREFRGLYSPPIKLPDQ
jgi:predicted DCC family thiol-disulfide oxidoreductase YuxK/uncharacterized membrane protein YphA (DoxX/SURF4 family)